ncbi:MAG: hypothetical protein ACI3V5_09670 [Faecousia sp.]
MLICDKKCPLFTAGASPGGCAVSLTFDTIAYEKSLIFHKQTPLYGVADSVILGKKNHRIPSHMIL